MNLEEETAAVAAWLFEKRWCFLGALPAGANQQEPDGVNVLLCKCGDGDISRSTAAQTWRTARPMTCDYRFDHAAKLSRLHTWLTL